MKAKIIKIGNSKGIRLPNELIKEYSNNNLFKWRKIHSLIFLIYIEISRVKSPLGNIKNQTYLTKLKMFEDLIELNFKTKKFVKEYVRKYVYREKKMKILD